LACPELKACPLKRRAGSHPYPLHDRHGFDHRDVQWPNPCGGKVHDVAGHWHWCLRQEHAQPAILQRLDHVADLPTILDAN